MTKHIGHISRKEITARKLLANIDPDYARNRTKQFFTRAAVYKRLAKRNMYYDKVKKDWVKL